MVLSDYSARDTWQQSKQSGGAAYNRGIIQQEASNLSINTILQQLCFSNLLINRTELRHPSSSSSQKSIPVLNFTRLSNISKQQKNLILLRLQFYCASKTNDQITTSGSCDNQSNILHTVVISGTPRDFATIYEPFDPQRGRDILQLLVSTIQLKRVLHRW